MDNALTPEQIESFRKRFNDLDITKTGKVDRETMAEILHDEAEQIEQLMIILLFEKYDLNHDGYISFEEFITFCSEMKDLSEVAILHQIFNLADVDGSGYLDVTEVERIGKLMGLDISKEDAWSTIDAFDRDGNEKIDFSEFLQIISNR
ncbi:EF hand family protein [Histomonas meleagridis]|uniref:EF hand family protein n=1 Tax=Histomonas meleagridis TaxID=135588 RepID=UPI003559A7FF|nr:EF hand family protein [Histomonas meleagridis]KAH0803703.1 EF hand family protein [Histomonas meleagridis]